MRLLLIALLLINLSAYSQENKGITSLNEGSIDEQFEFVLKKSSNYQNYKVIKRSMINTLKSHVIDSINKGKKELANAKEIITKQENDVKVLQQELATVNTNLEEVTASKDTIKLFGIPLKREVFKTVLWSIIGILLLSLLYLVYIFNNSNKITQKTLFDYEELNTEYNSYRTRSLEREQVLNRKLQDEINKQKKA